MSSLQTHPKKKAEFSLIQIDRDVLGPGHVFSMCSHWMGVTTLFYQLIHTISFVKVRCDLSAKFTQAKSLYFILLGIHSKATLGSEREVQVWVGVIQYIYMVRTLLNQICSEYTDLYRLVPVRRCIHALKRHYTCAFQCLIIIFILPIRLQSPLKTGIMSQSSAFTGSWFSVVPQQCYLRLERAGLAFISSGTFLWLGTLLQSGKARGRRMRTQRYNTRKR